MKILNILQKRIGFVIVLFLVLVLSACSQKQVMDQPAEDGNFYYRNKDLSFQVTLPPSFEYYQTQRITEDDYVEIMFLVPTSDTSSFEEVSGYAKPLTVRVYNSRPEDYGEFQEISHKNDNYYAINFWNNIPKDWQEKWSQEVRESIFNSLEVK